MKRSDTLRYIIVFVITLAIFLTVVALSSFLNGKKLESIKEIQDKISMDIISSETQFQLLQELSCKDVAASTLSGELNDLSLKIAYSEENIKKADDVTQLKKYYSLLQIKDYLLMEKIKTKCNTEIIPIFYFYTTAENCSECIKQSYVLTSLRETYPELRVYSFDYNLDLSALQSLIKIFKVEDTKLPALVINEKLYTGFQSQEAIEKMLPALEQMKNEQSIKTVESQKISTTPKK